MVVPCLNQFLLIGGIGAVIIGLYILAVREITFKQNVFRTGPIFTGRAALPFGIFCILIGLISMLLSIVELDNWSKAVCLFPLFLGGMFIALSLGVYIKRRD
jgi:hypothetical protein